ncbi:MAG: hypothetical protein Q7U68_01385 [Candidatus Roizmanbacteria bacterium]|nr:hypothetical protein [Candidatus Roizmanbacteria bacterium]
MGVNHKLNGMFMPINYSINFPEVVCIEKNKGEERYEEERIFAVSGEKAAVSPILQAWQ